MVMGTTLKHMTVLPSLSTNRAVQVSSSYARVDIAFPGSSTLASPSASGIGARNLAMSASSSSRAVVVEIHASIDCEPSLAAPATELLVYQRAVVQVSRRYLILFSPIVLRVLPFRHVETFRQQVHAAHDIARIEILWIDPGLQRQILLLGPQSWRDLARACCAHVIQQPAGEIRNQVGPQRPAGAEISEHPRHVGNAGEHHAAIGHGLGKYQRFR